MRYFFFSGISNQKNSKKTTYLTVSFPSVNFPSENDVLLSFIIKENLSIDEHLMITGWKEFDSKEDYESFLEIKS